MCETWVSIVRRDSNSLAAISGFDSPASSSAAILVSVGVRPSHLPRARRLFATGPRMPCARKPACSLATSAAAPSEP
jgi:hypothetical protein